MKMKRIVLLLSIQLYLGKLAIQLKISIKISFMIMAMQKQAIISKIY